MGCCNSIAEDFVQEMYIKIHNYSQTKEIKNIDVLAYFILRNLYYDHFRKEKSKPDMLRLDCTVRFGQAYEFDYQNVRIETLIIEQKEFNLDVEIAKSDQLTNLEALLSDPLIVSWYDKKILMEHYKEGVSMRKIGRDTNIGFPSIYNTVKKAREQLKTALYEKQGVRGYS